MTISFQTAQQHLTDTSADKIVVELLSATKGFAEPEFNSLTAKQFLLVADILGLTEASVRMALSRQTKQGKLIRENGAYALLKSHRQFTAPRFWLDIMQRPVAWKNDWILVNLLGTKMTSTAARRTQRRATTLGFQPILGLGWVRPNNLLDIASEARLHFTDTLGSEDFLVAALAVLDGESQTLFEKAWECDALDLFYHQGNDFLQHEIALLKGLSDREVLPRSFAVGRYLIDKIALDPWLPEQMVNTRVRKALVSRLKEYFQLIKSPWMNVLNQAR